MKRALIFAFTLMAAGCGLSVDTHVADWPTTRLALMRSVVIGQTTPTQLVSRWGHPYQKMREGGRVGYVYRPAGAGHIGFVIVEFEYNLAVNLRTTETETCRAEFSPRFPGYDWGTPQVVGVMGGCAPSSNVGAEPNSTVPGVAPDRYVPAPGSFK